MHLQEHVESSHVGVEAGHEIDLLHLHEQDIVSQSGILAGHDLDGALGQ